MQEQNGQIWTTNIKKKRLNCGCSSDFSSTATWKLKYQLFMQTVCGICSVKKFNESFQFLKIFLVPVYMLFIKSNI